MSHSADGHPEDSDEELYDQYDELLRRLEKYDEDDLIVEEDNLGGLRPEPETNEYYILSDDDAKELLSYYITTSAIIEGECSLIINAYVFDYGMKREGSLKFIEENFTQKMREDMLYYLGIIDSGLKGEISRVRSRRNELAHSREHNKVEDINQVISSVKRANNAKNKLQRKGIQVESGMHDNSHLK